MSSIFDLFAKIGKKEEHAPVSRIVVCLGNPGREYALTRHNAGFLFAEYYAMKKGFSVDRAKFRGLTGETVIGGERVLFLFPTTYMNASGEAARAALDFYKLPPERMLVICDDVNFDVGKLRIRRKGSDGGQKGLRSIIEQLNSDEFPRLRIGVGKKPSEDTDLVNWVLGKFSRDDLEKLKAVFENVSDALEYLVKDDFDTAMSKYNGK